MFDPVQGYVSMNKMLSSSVSTLTRGSLPGSQKVYVDGPFGSSVPFVKLRSGPSCGEAAIRLCMIRPVPTQIRVLCSYRGGIAIGTRRVDCGSK